MIDTDTIRALADERGELMASIYFPTHVMGREIQQDPIRLKNALQTLEQEAERQGLVTDAFRALLSHPAALIEDTTFWQHQSHGLALFCRPDGMTLVKLPFQPAEIAHLDVEFLVAPLLRASGDAPAFHLLALNREGSNLYDVEGDAIAERAIDPELESLEAARGMSAFSASAGFHTDHRGGTRSNSADGTPRYHALGTGDQEQEEKELWRYLLSIANAVEAALAGSQAPVVLAGGDRIVGRFRDIMKDDRIAESFVDTNTKSAEVEVLAADARPIAEAVTGSAKADALDTLEARMASGEKTAIQGADVLTIAAEEGRVDTAFLKLRMAPGTDADDAQKTRRAMDKIARLTLKHGGTVYPMPPQKEAELAPAAGLLRF